MDRVGKLLLDNDLTDTPYLVDEDYKDAILGYTDDKRLVYSYEKMVKYLVDNNGLKEDDAMDYIDYNVVGMLKSMGEKSPIIVYELSE